MILKIEHLKKTYDNVTPIKDINCEIEKGEIITIIGPSGTGKSTLLNCINGLEKVTSGKIFYHDIEITAPNFDIIKTRQKIGMVFQSFNLFSHLTVIENIMLAPIEILNEDKKQVYKRSMELLNTMELADKAFAYPQELSGGQQQRIAIVRSIAMEPEIILFDEPTSALDPAMIGEVEKLIIFLKEKGYTLLIVTHEIGFAKRVATRVLYLDEGVIYEEGTPEDIFEHPKKEKTIKFMSQKEVV